MIRFRFMVRISVRGMDSFRVRFEFRVGFRFRTRIEYQS